MLSTDALTHFRTRPPSEIGGLLLGKFESNAAGERSPVILGAEPIASEAALFNTTAACADRLSRALGSTKSDGLCVLGYYRSHAREGLCLGPLDQEWIERDLRDPDSFFVLVKPFEIGICTAGFFFWQDGRLQTDASDLEVPFVAFADVSVSEPGISTAAKIPQPPPTPAADPHFETEIPQTPPNPVLPSTQCQAESPEQPAPVTTGTHVHAKIPPRPVAPQRPASPAQGRPVPVPAMISAAPGRRVSRKIEPEPEATWNNKQIAPDPQSRSFLSAYVLITALLVIICSAAAFRMLSALPRVSSSMPQEARKADIDLRVIRMPGRQLELIWNRNVPEVQNAQQGLLLVKDGLLRKELRMDSAQLRSGALAYFPTNAFVQFQFEVLLDGTPSLLDSLLVMSPHTRDE